MTNYAISGAANLPSDKAVFLGRWEVRIPSSLGVAVDGDGSWRGGTEFFDVDRTSGACTATLPETTGDESYSARYVAKSGAIVGPFVFTLTEDTTWADIIGTPQTPPVPWTAEDAFVAGLYSTNSATRAATDARYFKKATGATTTIYVSTSGNDGNDGLAVGRPKTLQGAFTYLESLGYLMDTWVVQLAAGTYSVDNVRLGNIQSANRIQIKGPTASYGTPTALLDGGSTAGKVFGMILTGVYVYISDIKFQNYAPGDNTGTGLQIQDLSDAWLDNVHANNCDFVGVYGLSNTKFRVTGGTFSNCQRGIRAYTNCSYTIGYNASAHHVTISNCTYGFEARDASTGRLDYSDISGCGIGAWVYQASRCHAVSSTFTSCTTAAVAMHSGGFFFRDTSNTFTTNAIDISTGAGSAELSFGEYPSAVVGSALKGTPPTALTGTTSQTTIKTMDSIPARLMNEAGSQLIFELAGVFTGSGGTKTVNVRVNGTNLGSFVSSANSTKSFVCRFRMIAKDGSNQIVFVDGHEGGSGGILVAGKNTTAIPFSPTLNPAVVVQGTLGSSGDSIELTHAQWSYLPTSHKWS